MNMETYVNAYNLFPAVDYICKKNKSASKELSKYLAKQVGLTLNSISALVDN